MQNTDSRKRIWNGFRFRQTDMPFSFRGNFVTYLCKQVPNVWRNFGWLLYTRMKRVLPVSALSLPKPSASFGPSLVTTKIWPVQQTPALAVWKSDVRSKNQKLCKFKKDCPWRNGPPVSLMNNINLLTFVRRLYAVVFLRSLPSQTMHDCLRAYLLRHFLAAQCTHQ